MNDQLLLWGGFNLFVVLMLAIDLGAHRNNHQISFKEAIRWSIFWIALALTFNLGLYVWQGREAALAFLTGYLLEKSLSVDNLFVFLMVFSYFGVPAMYQHKVLFWGILGALMMRAIFIATGVTLLHYFHWVIYVFGAILIITGFRMGLSKKETTLKPQDNIILKLMARVIPFVTHYQDDKFFIQINGRRVATLLFAVLIVIETTDLLFALDSIPAVLAVTRDPFLVYSSNVFAILGLRALYFALAGVMQLFHFLHYGLAFVLVFIGGKMLLADIVKVPVGVALGVVVGAIIISIIVSMLKPLSKNKLEIMQH